MSKQLASKAVNEIPALNEIEKAVFTYFNHPEESKYCFCNICCEKYELREKGIAFLRTSSSIFKLDTYHLKKFYHFLSNLDSKICFRLQISTICFFENAEPKILMKSKANMVESLHLTSEIKKNIANYFSESKKLVNSADKLDISKDNHIKYFDTIIPKYKHGLENENSSNLPRNYTFHCNRKLDDDNQVFKISQSEVNEVAIIKYKDKGMELVNEKQLRMILKSAARTQNIDFIQGYVKPHEKLSEFIFSEYSQAKTVKNQLMYNRSLIQIKIEVNLLSRFSKDFVPLEHLEEYEQVLKEFPEEYCLYQTYKMIHYMQLLRDIKVQKLSTVWFRDESQELCFFGILFFEFQENDKIQPDVGEVKELKDLMDNQLTQLEKELLSAWENMKKRKCITTPNNEQLNQDHKQIEKIKEQNLNRKKRKESERVTSQKGKWVK